MVPSQHCGANERPLVPTIALTSPSHFELQVQKCRCSNLEATTSKHSCACAQQAAKLEKEDEVRIEEGASTELRLSNLVVSLLLIPAS